MKNSFLTPQLISSLLYPKPIKHPKKPHKKRLLKVPKEKTRSQLIKILDKKFSDFIKTKAKGICFKCERISKNAGVSHYFSRKYIGTRWDTENSAWSCWACHFHQLENFKQPGEWYYNYMMKKLGARGFSNLEIKAHAINKFSTVDIKNLIANFNSIWK